MFSPPEMFQSEDIHMAKITRLKQPPMVDFCGVCLDEGKCYDAGRCLFDAAQAQDMLEPVEPTPINGPIKPDRDND